MTSRKRRRHCPPSTLSWPAEDPIAALMPIPIQPIATSSYKLNTIRNNGAIETHGLFKNVPSMSSSSLLLWTDRYRPLSCKDLCVAPQKINVLKQWIQDVMVHGRTNNITSANNAAPQTVLPKLCVLVGGPGIGKSTMVRVIAEEMNLSILEWHDSCGEHGGGMRNGSFSANHGHTSISSMGLFEEFLQSVALPYKSVLEEKEVVGKDMVRTQPTIGSIVLLDELPNLHGQQQPMLSVLPERFRQTMRQYVEKTLTPTILVCSNVTEGRYKPEDLETYLDPELLYSPLVFILQVNPVTKAKMKSCLKDILNKEGILKYYSDEWLEELHLKCGGDLRHAITNAQFQLGVLKRSTCGTRNAKVLTSIQRRKGGGDEGGDYAKDVKLSTFHALGKLLYAKRVKEQEKEGGSLNGHWNTDQQPPLDFDPERVLEDGDIGITGALSFIQHHAPDFFTNIEELSCAFDLLSDGTFLLDGGHEKSRDSNTSTGNRFPLDYAASLCSRAVAYANRHPAPVKFRQLCAPTMYQVFRKRRDNMDKYDQVRKRLSFREYHLTLDVNTRSCEHFATDHLPFLKRILPQIVTTISGDIYSESQNFDTGIHHTPKIQDQEEEQNRAIIEFEQQRAILELDDIVDSSDNESDEEESIHGQNGCNIPIHTSANNNSSNNNNSNNNNNNNNKILPSQNDVIIID